MATDMDQSNLSDIIPAVERERMEFFQQIKVSMDMKTNVPEPYSPLLEAGTDLKEGLPSGLSDSQVESGISLLAPIIPLNLGEPRGQI